MGMKRHLGITLRGMCDSEKTIEIKEEKQLAILFAKSSCLLSRSCVFVMCLTQERIPRRDNQSKPFT
jgi:hypothetical protein